MAGVPVYLLLTRLPLWGYLVGLALLTAAAVPLADRAQEILGRRDDPRIVIDEVAGYVVTMIGVAPSFLGVVLGFVLFRTFDILKPWPCRTIDRRWHSGAGVVLDDVAAGIYAAAVMHAVILFWPICGQG